MHWLKRTPRPETTRQAVLRRLGVASPDDKRDALREAERIVRMTRAV